jgi:hypothetical protein
MLTRMQRESPALQVTQFTGFTGTKVQILTLSKLQAAACRMLGAMSRVRLWRSEEPGGGVSRSGGGGGGGAASNSLACRVLLEVCMRMLTYADVC